jgi:hypothetical protein
MSEDSGRPIVGDLAGVGKLADSKLANRTYDDALSPLMSQLGKLGEDVAKTARLILAPLQLLARGQDRFAEWMKQLAKDVPEERRQEAPAHIAGPVLQNLVFMEADNPLTRLFLELLKRAIDKERCHEAHPAFVEILKQLSPDEAMMLWLMRTPKTGKDGKTPVYEFKYRPPDDFPGLPHPEHTSAYALHLTSLKLGDCFVSHQWGTHQKDTLRLTDFGQLFIKACIPGDFRLPT